MNNSELSDRRQKLSPEAIARLERRLRGLEGQPSADVPVGRVTDLSYQQIHYLAQAEVDPRADASIVVRFRGEVDAELLELCLTRLVFRHSMLRVRYPNLSSQVIDEPYEVAMDRWRLPEREIFLAIDTELGEPFNFESSVRDFRFFQIAEAESILFIPMHHASVDGTSVEIFLSDLCCLYQAGGDLTHLATPMFTYMDYVASQMRERDSSSYQRQKSYWLSRPHVPNLQLRSGSDLPSGVVRKMNGQEVRVDIHVATRKLMSDFCSRNGVTSFMVLLAAFQRALSQFANDSEFEVGCVLAGRDREEAEGVFGCFINVVPMTCVADRGRGLFLSDVSLLREQIVDALDNASPAFEEITSALPNVRFDMRSFHLDHSIGNIECEILTVVPPPPADLCAVVRDRASALSLAIEFPDGVLEGRTVDRILRTWVDELASGLQEGNDDVGH